MKTIETLEKALAKEQELIEKHKQKAATIEKEIELRKGQATMKAVKALNLTGKQYDRFLQLLSSKKNVMEAVDLMVRDEGAILEGEGGENENSEKE